MVQPFARCTITDLIVVLQEQHKRAGRQMTAGFTARHPVSVVFALEHKTLAQAARQFLRGVVGELRVIGVCFAGQQHMQGVMAVIIPLRVKGFFQQARLIELVFQGQPHMAVRRGVAPYLMG